MKKIKKTFYYTGDNVIIKNKNIQITDRVKNIIIKGGVNISPSFIEKKILQISLVKKCYVFGQKDNLFGEKIVAAIECKKLKDKRLIIKKIGNKLTKLYLPDDVFFTKIYLNSTGKIDQEKVKSSYDNRF